MGRLGDVHRSHSPEQMECSCLKEWVPRREKTRTSSLNLCFSRSNRSLRYDLDISLKKKGNLTKLQVLIKEALSKLFNRRGTENMNLAHSLAEHRVLGLMVPPSVHAASLPGTFAKAIQGTDIYIRQTEKNMVLTAVQVSTTV
jgi:hypothetical protein